MNFKDFTSEIAKRSNVEYDIARRVIFQIYGFGNEQLDASEPFVLPQFGRIVPVKKDDGSNRYVLHRPGKKKDTDAA